MGVKKGATALVVALAAVLSNLGLGTAADLTPKTIVNFVLGPYAHCKATVAMEVSFFIQNEHGTDSDDIRVDPPSSGTTFNTRAGKFVTHMVIPAGAPIYTGATNTIDVSGFTLGSPLPPNKKPCM